MHVPSKFSKGLQETKAPGVPELALQSREHSAMPHVFTYMPTSYKCICEYMQEVVTGSELAGGQQISTL